MHRESNHYISTRRVKCLQNIISVYSYITYIHGNLTVFSKEQMCSEAGCRRWHRQIDRQTGRQAGRQADRQTDRQRDRQTDRQTDNPYLSTILIKAVQLVGSCINTITNKISY